MFKNVSLYVHFPFCIRKCRYCDFCSSPQTQEVISRYISCLCHELRIKAKLYPNIVVDTLYFGGGTPSIVPPYLMKLVLETLHCQFHIENGCEFTTEANPGTITRQWLETMIQGGMNRLSLGAQSMQNSLLKRLGRIHNAEDVCTSIELAKEVGISNINIDVMYGLPSQKTCDYLETLEAIVKLHPQHISSYSLILEEHTPLFDSVSNGTETLPDETQLFDMEQKGREYLKHQGYARYEISNYALKGQECRHNIGYWQDKPYLGFGVAAHGMIPADGFSEEKAVRYRYSNTTNIADYCNGLDVGDLSSVQFTEPISEKEARFETMMLGLRMVNGISNQHFLRTHGITLTDCWGDILNRLIQQGLAKWVSHQDDARFALTERGLDVQNAVVLNFMEE